MKDVVEKAEFNNLASVDRNWNSDSFIRKTFLKDVMASFNSFTYKTSLFKFGDELFTSNSWKTGHFRQ